MPNPKALCPCYNCHPSGISVTKTTIKRHLAIQANAYGPGISTPPHLSRPRPVVAPVVAPIAPLPTIRDVVIPVVMIDQVTSTTKAPAPPVASTSSAPYSSISSSSVLDLKAELSQQQDLFNRTRHLGSTVTGIKRSKPSVWKQNKGINDRISRDKLRYEDDKSLTNRDPTVAKEGLERKAKLYDKIKRGKMSGLDANQIDNLLVDFNSKSDDLDSSDSDSDDEEDESATVPNRIIGDDDPLVDFTDEFGRTRQLRRSELPVGQAIHTAPPFEYQDESNVIYGDQSSFPVYEPTADVVAARAAAYAASAPLASYYNSAADNRTKAAGFYQFSQDETIRAQQMAALQEDRERTERERSKNELVGKVRNEEKEERKRKIAEKRRGNELKGRAVVAVEDDDAEQNDQSKKMKEAR